MLPAWVLTLLLQALLCLGEECGVGTIGDTFSIWQPCHLSAQAKESITLPCKFSYSWKVPPNPEIWVYWRLGSFHSQTYLFNHTSQKLYTHKNFSRRVSLVGDPEKKHEASIQIGSLSELDSNIYFCRISVQTEKKRKTWQSIKGTNLTVTAAAPTQPYSILGLVVGPILSIMAISLVLMMYLSWKKGHCPGCLQNTRVAGKSKKRPGTMEHKEVGFQEVRTPHPGPPATPQSPPCPLKPPVEPNLLYATLMLPDAKSQTPKPPRNRPGHGGQETTYAVVRH
nr:paired immunoglobulin-like type 2 receptor beta isoform X1 [Pogona vitticeps]